MTTERSQTPFIMHTSPTLELPNGKRALFLGQIDRCFISGEPSQHTDPMRGVPLQTEHIIPRLAAKQHPRLLKPLKDCYENIGHLCQQCHHRVDRANNSKMDNYRAHGVTGLMEWLAVYYPRSSDSNLFTIQHLQWQLLFRKVQDSFRNLRDEYPPHLASDYSRAREMVDIHLEQWQAGRFR